MSRSPFDLDDRDRKKRRKDPVPIGAMDTDVFTNIDEDLGELADLDELNNLDPF